MSFFFPLSKVQCSPLPLHYYATKRQKTVFEPQHAKSVLNAYATTKAHTSLRNAVLSVRPLFAHAIYRLRSLGQNARDLRSVNGWACAFETSKIEINVEPLKVKYQGI